MVAEVGAPAHSSRWSNQAQSKPIGVNSSVVPHHLQNLGHRRHRSARHAHHPCPGGRQKILRV